MSNIVSSLTAVCAKWSPRIDRLISQPPYIATRNNTHTRTGPSTSSHSHLIFCSVGLTGRCVASPGLDFHQWHEHPLARLSLFGSSSSAGAADFLVIIGISGGGFLGLGGHSQLADIFFSLLFLLIHDFSREARSLVPPPPSQCVVRKTRCRTAPQQWERFIPTNPVDSKVQRRSCSRNH